MLFSALQHDPVKPVSSQDVYTVRDVLAKAADARAAARHDQHWQVPGSTTLMHRQGRSGEF